MKVCWILFVAIIGLLVLVLSPLGKLLHIPGDVRSYAPPLGVLGALLIISSAAARAGRALKVFLIITGSSAVGFPASLYLHSLLFRFFPSEPVTYFLVFYILPVAFIVGAVGTIAFGIKRLLGRARG